MIVHVNHSKGSTTARMHVNIGPEGEALMDLQGRQEVDVTEFVKNLSNLLTSGGFKEVKLIVSRTRCEIDTLEDVKSLKYPHGYMTMQLPAFNGGEVAQAESEAVEAGDELDAFTQTQAAAEAAAPTPKPEPAKSSVKTAKLHWGRCFYCGGEEPMLPIPGEHICVTCARIELGRIRQKMGTSASGKDTAVPPGV